MSVFGINENDPKMYAHNNPNV